MSNRFKITCGKMDFFFLLFVVFYMEIRLIFLCFYMHMNHKEYTKNVNDGWECIVFIRIKFAKKFLSWSLYLLLFLFFPLKMLPLDMFLDQQIDHRCRGESLITNRLLYQIAWLYCTLDEIVELLWNIEKKKNKFFIMILVFYFYL